MLGGQHGSFPRALAEANLCQVTLWSFHDSASWLCASGTKSPDPEDPGLHPETKVPRCPSHCSKPEAPTEIGGALGFVTAGICL